jgi:hypothetical protein
MNQARRETLAAAALAWVRERASDVGLDPEAVALRPLLNWGGFVNTSFHATDGLARRHLKVTTSVDSLGLVTWAGVHERLSTRAPSGQGALLELYGRG